MKVGMFLSRRRFSDNEVNNFAANIHSEIFTLHDGNEDMIIKELKDTIDDLGKRAASAMSFFHQFTADRLELILKNYDKTLLG